MRCHAGMDGCRGGWVVAIATDGADGGGTLRIDVARDFAEALAFAASASRIAVDMPIGLLDVPQPGGRACDRAARAVLGRQGSSVFSPPARPALDASDHRDAQRRQGAGLSIQTWNIVPRIREVDAAIDASMQSRVIEAHRRTRVPRARRCAARAQVDRGRIRGTRRAAAVGVRCGAARSRGGASSDRAFGAEARRPGGRVRPRARGAPRGRGFRVPVAGRRSARRCAGAADGDLVLAIAVRRIGAGRCRAMSPSHASPTRGAVPDAARRRHRVVHCGKYGASSSRIRGGAFAPVIRSRTMPSRSMR